MDRLKKLGVSLGVAVKVIGLPSSLILVSLGAASYVLGLPFDSQMPSVNILLHRECSGQQMKKVELRPEIIFDPQFNLTFPSSLKIQLETDAGPIRCTGGDMIVTDLSWVTSANIEASDRGTIGFGKHVKIPISFEREHGYSEFTVASPLHADKVTLNGSLAMPIGFATKGVVLNLQIADSDGQDILIYLSLPQGFQLDQSTSPAPVSMQSGPGPQQMYGFSLGAVPRGLLGRSANNSLKLIYFSEVKKKAQDYLLFILAAIFGCAVQMMIDALRNYPTRQASAEH